MMLDLNLSVVFDPTCEEGDSWPVPEKLQEASSGYVNDSGTSNSSVVNVEAGAEDDYSSTHSNHREGGGGGFPGPGFDFLKRGGGGFQVGGDDGEEEEENGVSLQLGFVTRQLFPVKSGGAVAGLRSVPASASASSSSSSSSAVRNWADLNFAQPEVKVEAKVSPPQSKKSRRGPRSRSSQYRGVTFYRRTGRWESHIWLEFCSNALYI